MRKLALLALLVAGACGQSSESTPPPLDRFYYPTGLAVTKLANGDTALLVASSNFDLQYDTAAGGTVIAVDVDATIQKNEHVPTGELVPVVAGGSQGGAKAIGSFSGELVVVDETTCRGWETDPEKGTPTGRSKLALVASRSQGVLYRMTLDGAGGLACDGASCTIPLDPTSADPYGVGVACGFFPPVDAATGQPVADAPPTYQALGYVTYLRTLNAFGRLTQVDLDHPGTAPRLFDLGLSPSSSVVFDPATARLYVTSRFGQNAFAPLRWMDLAAPGLPRDIADLGASVRGLEMRQLRLSSPGAPAPKRGYLAMRVYDEDLAATIGGRPPTDLSGALGVLDLTEQPSGSPLIAVVNTVGVGHGTNEVQVIPRSDAAGNRLRDLVAVSSTDDDVVSLYDDETGSVAAVFGVCGAADEGVSPPDPCPPGKPALGKQPFGLAVEPFQRGDLPGVALARLYVGSFDRSWVNVIEVDPAHPAARTVNGVKLNWYRIGAQRP